MKKQLKTKITKIVQGQIERIRKQHKEIFEGMSCADDDPCADVTISEKADSVLVTYDGAGYDWFSMQADFNASETTRNNLQEAFEKIGVMMEDNNTWSFEVWEA